VAFHSIIFVHELGGHRVESWKPRNAIDPWPQTLLPPEVPYARILTVGHNFWFQHGPAVSSKTTIKSYSQRLLEEVAWYRWHDKTVGFLSILFNGPLELICLE
jgi:hypothetical protein